MVTGISHILHVQHLLCPSGCCAADGRASGGTMIAVTVAAVANSWVVVRCNCVCGPGVAVFSQRVAAMDSPVDLQALAAAGVECSGSGGRLALGWHLPTERRRDAVL